MGRIINLLPVIGCFLVICASGVQAAPFTNGSFEASTLPYTSFRGGVVTIYQGDANASAIAGWTVTGGSIDYNSTDCWQAAEGAMTVDLNGLSTGSISQTFDTTAGTVYKVTFSLSGNPDWPNLCPPRKELLVSAAGYNAYYTFDTTGKSRTSMGFVGRTFYFIASSDQTTLCFQSLTTGDTPVCGPVIDNVAVQACPGVSGPIINLWGTRSDSSTFTITGIMNLTTSLILNGSAPVILNGGSITGETGASLTNNGEFTGQGIIYVPVINNGSFTVTGDLTSFAGGDAFVQNGTLVINKNVAMKGMDSGGNDYAFVQTGSTSVSTISGILDFSNGQLIIQDGNFTVGQGGSALAQYIFMNGGTLTVGQECAMKGFDGGGSDVAYTQTGGTATVEGSLDCSTATMAIQGGSFNIMNEGSVGAKYIDMNGGSLYIQQGCAMKGFDAGGRGIAYTQTGGTATVNGTLTTAMAGLEGGILGGNGTVAGSLFADGGILSPGTSPGMLTIAGDFDQGSENTLAVEIRGTAAGEFDTLVVNGAADVSGTLTVTLLDGFMPAIGDTFVIMTCASRTGEFSAVHLPELTSGAWSVSYGESSVVLEVTEVSAGGESSESGGGSGGGGGGGCFISAAASGASLMPSLPAMLIPLALAGIGIRRRMR